MAEVVTLPVRGTVDGQGRLARADPPLERLQEQAGAALGSSLAVPQLADLARLARELGVTLSRPALAGTVDGELDLWVRAEPVADEVRLSIERWVERPAPLGRWAELTRSSAPASSAGDHRLEVDAELRITHVGRDLAKLLRVGADDAIGLSLTRLVQLEADADGDLPLIAALASRREFRGQGATVRRGGAPLVLSAEPVIDADGSFRGYRGRADDRVAASADGLADDAEWNELLRQPLDVIVTEAERISEKGEGPLRADYAAYASDIAGAAKHLLEVLRSMGQDAAEPEGTNEPIDLAALAAEAAGLVQPQAAEAKVALELEGATSLPAIGQSRAVTQILVNLIGNAVRFSPEGGAVRIEAEGGAAARVSVSDQGPGVAPQDRERIFDRFEQAAPRGQGAGLGLAISRRLARSMGGDISLDDVPGKGARFTLALPPR